MPSPAANRSQTLPSAWLEELADEQARRVEEMMERKT
jgi:hypothetical protein